MTRPATRLGAWLAALLRRITTEPTCARGDLVEPPAVADATATLAGPPVDPARPALPDRRTIELAARNGAASLLWSVLHQTQCTDALAPEVRTLLRAARDREAALALESAAAAQHLVDGLLERGVPVIALKGLALRSALYGPLGLTRAPGDIDIMVAREHLDIARELLRQQGYVPSENRPPDAYDNHQHIEPYRLEGSPSVIVDVHWTPLHPRSPYRVDVQQWWQSAVPLADAPEGLLRLGDLDLALQYALQIDFADAYAGKGRGLFDWAAWVIHQGIALEDLHRRASEGGATVAVPRMAAIVDRTFGSRMADALREKATPTGLVGVAWKRAVDASLWWPTTPPRIPLWYVHYCSRALGRAPTLAAALEVLVRPVLQNPRLGGRGFRAYPTERS